MATRDLPDLGPAVRYLKEKRNLFLGVTAVFVLLIAVLAFTRSQLRAAQVRPWQTFFAEGLPGMHSAEELQALSTELEGMDPAPLALYWSAVRAYQDEDSEAASATLASFREKFPDHYLVTNNVPSASNPSDPLLDNPAATQFERDAARYEEWFRTSGFTTSNPPPSEEARVALVTDRGTIEIALYLDQSPESARAFLEYAKTLEGQYIANVLEGQWVEIGQSETAEPLVLPGIEEASFPPHEQNSLAHFSGAVSFRQRPFSRGPRHGDLRVRLTEDFREDGFSTVFGTVTEGMAILEQIAAAEKDENRSTVLRSPVVIREVRLPEGTDSPTADTPPVSEDGEQ